MEFRDYYQTLGLQRGASADEIRKAYRRLARKYHPDVSKEADALERFKQMQEAYEVLKDPKKREAYDQLGANWKQGEQFRPPPDFGAGFDFSPGPAAAPSRPATPAVPVAAAMNSRTARSSVTSSPPCSAGVRSPSAGPPVVARAGAPGVTSMPASTWIWEEAHRGVVRNITLQQESVAGGAPIERTLRVTVPAGVTDGQSLRLGGQGEAPPGKGAKAGDLYLTVHIRPHRNLELDGRDVKLTLPVAPWEAALGGHSPGSDAGRSGGSAHSAAVAVGQPAAVTGRGMAGDPPGDQYVVLKVVLPPADTPAARKLYEQMQTELAFDPRAHF